MRKLTFVFGIFFASSLISVARADFDLTKWQLKKDITSPAGKDLRGVVLGEVSFDNEVFSGASADLRDIRVIDNANKEVPYTLTAETPKSGRENYSVKIINKGQVGLEYSTFVVDLGQNGILHNQLEIITDSKNFRRRAAIEGAASLDQKDWLKLAEKSIYDYSYEFKAKDTSVRYQESTLRFLRVKIFDNGEKPISIYGANVYREVSNGAREVNYKGAIISQELKGRERASVFTIDLGYKGLPTNKISLETNDINFNREAAIEGSNDGQNWSVVSYRDVIFSYRTPKFEGAKMELNYPESNFHYYRLTVFNKDDNPIPINQVSFSGFLRKLVFQYNPNNSYALYYDNPGARFPEYDLKNYLDYYSQDNRQPFKLMGETANGAYVPPKLPVKPLSERNPNLLLLTLVFIGAIVGFLIFRLFRKMEIK